ncbi:MAG: HAMP domain-containing sensor histidine kinase [Bacillota bacterium]|nr:HAMP domain-containing sensor histidine kinase [Bacillota bacterium]
MDYIRFIPLWILAFMTFTIQPKSRTHQWFSLAVFFSGGGAFSIFLKQHFVSYANLYMSHTFFPQLLNEIVILFNIATGLAFPYCTLMFAMSYSDLFKNPKLVRIKLIISFSLLISGIFIVLSIPKKDFINISNFPSDIKLITFWIVPTTAIINAILIIAYLKAKLKIEKFQRLLVCIICIPTITTNLFSSYIFILMGVNNSLRYLISSFAAFFLFIMLLFFTLKYGVLGIKIKIENSYNHNYIKSSLLGTSTINHSLKNEIANISMCLQLFNSAVSNCSDKEFKNKQKSTIEILHRSVNRLLEISSKINDQTKDVKLYDSPISLYRVVEEALSQAYPLLQSKQIKVSVIFSYNVTILGDAFHLREVISNIIRNAVEAMDIDGVLTIELLRYKKHVTLSIKDTGVGIPKECLNLVMEPFFSTKEHGLNFGLGLTYCYNIMQKHGGSIDIDVVEGEGTTVLLNFSPKKVLEITLGEPSSI